MNDGIAPSRSAWRQLPADIRGTDAVAAVAYGRWLMRWALRMLAVAGAGIVLFFAALIAGPRFPAPAIVIMAIPALAFVAMSVLLRRGNGLLQLNVPIVAARPGADLPSETRLGARRPGLQLVAVLAIFVGLLVALPLANPSSVKTWILEALGILAVVAVLASGPIALGMETGVLDASGLRIDFTGVRVPWTSIGSVRVLDPRQIVVEIVGPVTADAAGPGRWTQAALRRLEPGKRLRISTSRPELAVWVAGRFLVTGMVPADRRAA